MNSLIVELAGLRGRLIGRRVERDVQVRGDPGGKKMEHVDRAAGEQYAGDDEQKLLHARRRLARLWWNPGTVPFDFAQAPRATSRGGTLRIPPWKGPPTL